MVVVTPPVETNLFRLVDRADKQPDPNRQQLDFCERDFDVAGNDEALVEDAIKNFDQSGGSAMAFDH